MCSKIYLNNKSQVSTIKKMLFILIVVILIFESGCGNGNDSFSTSSNASKNIEVAMPNPVPLTPGHQANYRVVISNLGDHDLTNLTWSTIENPINPTARIDISTSTCAQILANQSCSIMIKTDSPGSYVLEGAVNGKKLITIPTSVYTHTASTQDLSGALTISKFVPQLVLRPSTENNSLALTYSGKTSLYITNNYNAVLDITNLFDDLPSNISYSSSTCPNPLPYHEVCQIILNYDGPINNDIQVILHPNGKIINQDGSKTPLPKQYSSETLRITKNTLANLVIEAVSLNLNGQTPNFANKAIGYVINSGKATTMINKITILNNQDGTFNVSNNNCGSIDPNGVCSYVINADVEKLAPLASGNYRNQLNIDAGNNILSGILSYLYSKAPTQALPAITISGPDELDQGNLNGNITIKNTGNVELEKLSMPQLSGDARDLVLSDPNHCTNKNLKINDSCSFIINFTPSPPSENTVVTIGGVSADFVNATNLKSHITFNADTGIKVYSSFRGTLKISPPVVLTSTNPAETIVVTNTGNYLAQIGQILISSSSNNNIKSSGSGTCKNGKTLRPGDTCTIDIQLINSSSIGSGNSKLNILYNNNDGENAASAATNVNWLVGEVTSLKVDFMPDNDLVTEVGGSTSLLISITNNGNSALSQIQLPNLPNDYYLSYSKYNGSNACNLVNQQLSNQSLLQNQSCIVNLTYTPLTALSQQSVDIGEFSANNQSYFTDKYSVNLQANSPSSLKLSPTKLEPQLNWTNSTSYSADLLLTNVGGSTINTITTQISSGLNTTLSTTGCNQPLLSGKSCDLKIAGDYINNLSNSYNSNSLITIISTDPLHTQQHVVKVDAVVAMEPKVTPGLNLVGNLPSTIYLNSPSVVPLELTNITTATNGGNQNIKVNLNSLTKNIGDGISAKLTTTGIINNSCKEDGNGNVNLDTGEFCYINLVLNATGTNTGFIQVNISADYQYYNYDTTSITPVLNSAKGLQVPSLSGRIDIQSAMPALNLSYTSSLGYLTANLNESPPSTVMIIKNVGNVTINSFSFPVAQNISFNPSTNCTNLAVESSCSVIVTLNTSTIVARNNLDKAILSYTYLGNQANSMNLPYLRYNVVGPNSPNLQYTISLVNCGIGSIFTNNFQKCNLNQLNNGIPGDLSAFRYIITLTNLGTSSTPSIYACNDSTPLLPSNFRTLVYFLGKLGPGESYSCVFASNNNTRQLTPTYTKAAGGLFSRVRITTSTKKIYLDITNPTITTIDFTPLNLFLNPSNLSIAPLGNDVNIEAIFSNLYESLNLSNIIISWGSNQGYCNGDYYSIINYPLNSPKCSVNNTCSYTFSTAFPPYISGTFSPSTQNACQLIATYYNYLSNPNTATTNLTFPLPSSPQLVPFYPQGCTLGSTCTCIQESNSGDVWYANLSPSLVNSWESAEQWSTSLNAPSGGGTSPNGTCGFDSGWKLPSYAQMNDILELVSYAYSMGYPIGFNTSFSSINWIYGASVNANSAWVLYFGGSKLPHFNQIPKSGSFSPAFVWAVHSATK